MVQNTLTFIQRRDIKNIKQKELKSATILEILDETETLEMNEIGNAIFSRKWAEGRVPNKCIKRTEA